MARRRKRPTTKAVLSAAHQLGIDNDDVLARVMRCSVETVRRYRSGDELARIAFHLQTSWLLIDTAKLVGGRRLPGETAAEWLAKFDDDLGTHPGDLLIGEWGLDRLHGWLSRPQQASETKLERRLPSRSRAKRKLPLGRAGSAAPQPEPPQPVPPTEPKVEAPADSNWWRLVAGGAAAIGATVAGAVLWIARNKR